MGRCAGLPSLPRLPPAPRGGPEAAPPLGDPVSLGLGGGDDGGGDEGVGVGLSLGGALDDGGSVVGDSEGLCERDGLGGATEGA